MNDRKSTTDVRNAIFKVANGKPSDAVFNGIAMAWSQIASDVCGGDEKKTADLIEHYHKIMMDAVPIYCTQTQTGQMRAELGRERP